MSHSLEAPGSGLAVQEISFEPSRFYIQRFSEKFWNNGCPDAAVIQAEDVIAPSVKILGPQKIFKDFEILSKKHFIECEGPARTLSKDEYWELISRLDLSIPAHILDRMRPQPPAPTAFSLFSCTIL